MTRTAALGLMLCLTATACGGNGPTEPSPGTPAPSNGYAGRWTGTVLVLPLVAPGSGPLTIRSQPLSFTISADQRVTDISIGYDFNGCSGVRTFPGLSIAIGASPFGSQGQGWGFGSPTSDRTDHIQVYGAFTSDRTATGTSLFIEFPGCNSGVGNWSATKQ